MRLTKTLALGFTCLMAVTTTAIADSHKNKTVEFLTAGKKSDSGPPFSEAVRAGDTLYLSGKLGTDPNTRKLAEGGIKAEAQQTMENISATLQKHGYSMDNIVKCTIMLADIGDYNVFNAVYKTFFKNHYPARSAFAASGLALNARVEVECLAYVV